MEKLTEAGNRSLTLLFLILAGLLKLKTSHARELVHNIHVILVSHHEMLTFVGQNVAPIIGRRKLL